jgi:hypothetical protein
MLKQKMFTALSLLLLAAGPALASGGDIVISVSGGDAQDYGGGGGSAGSVDLHLAYADAAKTLVTLSGSTKIGSRVKAISQQVAIKDLNSISIYARGGSGGNGYSGSSGSNGSDGSSGSNGWNGSDGCPPSDGSRGGDGGNGSNGGDGSDGGNGGNGGSGGSIHVATSPDESELLLFVRTDESGGSAGGGGSGGSGGSAGRGGSGGSGGRGGSNNCKDDKGNPTGGSDGSSGSNGSNGSDGSSGRSGSNGYDGRGGRSGSRSFDLVAADGTKQSFASAFRLEFSALTFLDDNQDGILEPGERVYVSSAQITNKGPMPSPANQAIRFSFVNTATLLAPAPLAVTFPAVAAGAQMNLDLKKGELALQVPNSVGLIGKKAMASARLSINNVSIAFDIDPKMSIHWPATMIPASTKISANFEVAKEIPLKVQNVGSQDLGPKGDQPFELAFAWTSKTTPASDVSLGLPDGRVLSLAQLNIISDLTVPAKSTATFPLKLLVRDTKLIKAGAGTLTVGLRLRELSSPNEQSIQTLSYSVSLALDVKSLDWQQSINLRASNVKCTFPKLASPLQAMDSILISKVPGTDRVVVQVGAAALLSPAFVGTDAKLLPYYEQFRENPSPAAFADFLNKFVSPLSPKSGPWAFQGCVVAAGTTR